MPGGGREREGNGLGNMGRRGKAWEGVGRHEDSWGIGGGRGRHGKALGQEGRRAGREAGRHL